MADRLVFVYKSRNKQGRYLYLKEKDVFAHIPAGLLGVVGCAALLGSRGSGVVVLVTA